MVLACYPTTADNPRPDYSLSTGKVVPHMQTGSDARIGGFGASMGGGTMMLLGGAGLTTTYPWLSWNQVTRDPRIKAAVGYVPYFGQPFLP